MVSDVAISPDDSECLVLAKVMEVAKEIRPDDKNAGPLRLGAGRLCGLLAADSLLWGPEMQGGRAAPPGRWSAGDGWGGQWSGGDLLRQFGGI